MKRLLSLDVMRGVTIAAMIVVNNGAGPSPFASLQHSAWNGLTPCDVVFPFFLFIMGVAVYLSLAKGGFKPEWKVIERIMRRAALIILIGWALHFVEDLCKDRLGLGLRFTGVLPRIGVCYGIVAMAALFVGRRAMAAAAWTLLAVYGILLLAMHGYEASYANVNSMVDGSLIGRDHLYRKSPVDPEGLLSTISALFNVVAGFLCGAVIRSDRDMSSRLVSIMVRGFGMLALGYILSEFMPVNKRVWSPTFALITSGLGCLTLASLIYVIDVKDYRCGITFFESFGINPLFLYVVAELMGVLIGCYGNKQLIYECIYSICPVAPVASLIYSLCFLAVVAAMAYPLYRRRIYIKI